MATTIENLQPINDKPKNLTEPSMLLKRPSTRRGDIQTSISMVDDQYKQPGTKYREIELLSNMISGSCIGMAVGGTLGVINATLAVLISPFFFPGIDLLITQPLEAALIGAALGIACGGLAGTLLGWCISGTRIQKFEQDLKSNQEHEQPSANYLNDELRAAAWKEQHGKYSRI